MPRRIVAEAAWPMKAYGEQVRRRMFLYGQKGHLKGAYI
jgi:hypothetical protein